MVYELDLPDEIEDRLLALAAANEMEVEQLIHIAVVQFVQTEILRQEKIGWQFDPSFELTATSAPVDLPLLGRRLPVSVKVHAESRLRPDPIMFDDGTERRRSII